MWRIDCTCTVYIIMYVYCVHTYIYTGKCTRLFFVDKWPENWKHELSFTISWHRTDQQHLHLDSKCQKIHLRRNTKTCCFHRHILHRFRTSPHHSHRCSLKDSTQRIITNIFAAFCECTCTYFRRFHQCMRQGIHNWTSLCHQDKFLHFDKHLQCSHWCYLSQNKQIKINCKNTLIS